MTVPPVLVCPEGPCTVTRATVGALAAHLVEDHAISSAVALQRARQADPAPLPASRTAALDVDKYEFTKHVEKPEVAGQEIQSFQPPAASPPIEETPMPPGVYERTPKACCGSTGPRHKKDCTKASGGKTKRAAKPRTGGGTRSKKKPRRAPAAVAMSSNGHAPVGDEIAKKAGATYVGHLKRIRANLDRLIGTVEESLELL